MSHITIPESYAPVTFVIGGTPSTGPFTIPSTFRFFNTDDIRLKYDDTELENGVDFTVTPSTTYEGGYDGGTITLASPLSNLTLVCWRDIPVARTTDFPNAGAFDITALNTQLDKHTAMLQERRRENERSLRQPDQDVTDLSPMPDAADRVNKVIHFGADGVTPTASTMTITALEAGATDAAASAAAAAASETAAAASAAAAAAAVDAKITVSTSPPSGGSDGDVWFQVT